MSGQICKQTPGQPKCIWKRKLKHKVKLLPYTCIRCLFVFWSHEDNATQNVHIVSLYYCYRDSG